MAQHGKRYRDARASFEREQVYSPVEAVRLLKAMGATKFDETVELHFRLGLNVRHADEQLRGTLMLPHGSGKEVRIAETKMPDLNARDIDQAAKIIAGTARSMGVEVDL